MKTLVRMLLTSAILLSTSQSLALDHDVASWQGFIAQGNVNEATPWGYFIEAQQRVGRDQSNMNRLLMRWAVRYELKPGLFLYAGHAWTPNMAPFRDEHRLWQQVQYNFKWNEIPVALRFRQEQRDIDDTEGISERSRLLVRAVLPRADSVFNWAIWDEYFYNLNTVQGGPEAGFDQNRLFIGPSFPIHGGKVLIEPGYMNVYTIRARRAEDISFHVFTVYAFMNF